MLPNNGNSKRNLKKEEEIIVRRRNAEVERHRLWTGVNDYFKTWNVSVNKYSNWASPEFYNYSSDSRMKLMDAEKRKEKLEERRRCLLLLLTEEENGYRNELKELRKPKPLQIEDLCHMNLEMRRRTDEATRREAELKLYHRSMFPPPGQFRKQYGYFTAKAEKENMNPIQLGRNEKSAVQNSRKALAEMELIKNEEKRLQTEIMKLESELGTIMEKLKDNEGKRHHLRSEEIKKPDKLTHVCKLIEGLDINSSNNDEVQPKTNYQNRWKLKCKEVQEELQKELSLLQDVSLFVKELDTDYAFLHKVEKNKKCLHKTLQTEAGRERLCHLLECTYKEPSKWWNEEMNRWKEDKEERRKIMADMYSGLLAVVDKWAAKNLNEQQLLLKAEGDLLSQIETIKKSIEMNESAIKNLVTK